MSGETCKCDCHPNYESEYYRLIEEVKRLENENCELRETILGMCKALFRESESNESLSMR